MRPSRDARFPGPWRGFPASRLRPRSAEKGVKQRRQAKASSKDVVYVFARRICSTYLLDVFSVVAPQTQIAPPASAATGRISTAVERVLRSEMAPTRTGDRMSPSAWMLNTLTATAIVRISGRTTFTMCELMGPVEANIKSWAPIIAGQNVPGEGAARER